MNTHYILLQKISNGFASILFCLGDQKTKKKKNVIRFSTLCCGIVKMEDETDLWYRDVRLLSITLDDWWTLVSGLVVPRAIERKCGGWAEEKGREERGTGRAMSYIIHPVYWSRGEKANGSRQKQCNLNVKRTCRASEQPSPLLTVAYSSPYSSCPSIQLHPSSDRNGV